jgi:hypothetical protein
MTTDVSSRPAASSIATRSAAVTLACSEIGPAQSSGCTDQSPVLLHLTWMSRPDILRRLPDSTRRVIGENYDSFVPERGQRVELGRAARRAIAARTPITTPSTAIVASIPIGRCIGAVVSAWRCAGYGG